MQQREQVEGLLCQRLWPKVFGDKSKNANSHCGKKNKMEGHLGKGRNAWEGGGGEEGMGSREEQA